MSNGERVERKGEKIGESGAKGRACKCKCIDMDILVKNKEHSNAQGKRGSSRDAVLLPEPSGLGPG